MYDGAATLGAYICCISIIMIFFGGYGYFSDHGGEGYLVIFILGIVAISICIISFIILNIAMFYLEYRYKKQQLLSV